MKQFIAVVLTLAIAAGATAQMRFTDPGPDPRSRGFRPYKPRIKLVLYIQVDTIVRGVATENQERTIKRLRDKIVDEPSEAKQQELIDRLIALEETIEKNGDWLLFGMATSNKVKRYAEVRLRLPPSHAKKISDLTEGDFVSTIDPYPEGDSPSHYKSKHTVTKALPPSWWLGVKSRNSPQPNPIRPTAPTAPRIDYINPTIDSSWPVKYPFHQKIYPDEDRELAEVVECVMPAVFTIYSTDKVGTGFVINKQGTAITNQHVIEGAREFEAEFADGKRVKGRVIGIAGHADIALLSLAKGEYPFVPLDNPPSVRIGDSLFAIGAPHDFGHSVSAGIVSSFRTIDKVEHIQTDAAINPGNSGGPIINGHGAVVAIATLKLRESEGLGFGIRIGEAISRLPIELKAHTGKKKPVP